MDLSKLRLNEINLDLFMKYFKNGYISNSLLDPAKLPVQTKWYKYTYTDNNEIIHTVYSIYPIEFEYINSNGENIVKITDENIEILNNFFSVDSITTSSIIKEPDITEASQVYSCSANYFTYNAQLLYTKSQYSFIQTINNTEKVFYNVTIDIDNYKETYVPSIVRNYSILLNGIPYIYDMLTEVTNENDAYYKKGIKTYRVSNRQDTLGYLIENQPLYTNINEAGQEIYIDIHGNNVIGNDTPTLFETHANEIRSAINNNNGGDLFLMNNGYPSFKDILVVEGENISFKIIDEIISYKTYQAVQNDNTVFTVNMPVLSNANDLDTLLNSNSVVIEPEVHAKYVETISSFAESSEIPLYVYANDTKIFDSKYDNYFYNQLIKINLYKMHPYIGEENEKSASYYDILIDTNGQEVSYLVPKGASMSYYDKKVIKRVSPTSFIYEIKYSDLNSEKSFNLFGNKYTVELNGNTVAIITPEEDKIYMEYQNILSIPIKCKAEFDKTLYCHVEANTITAIDENNTGHIVVNSNITTPKNGNYELPSLKKRLYNHEYTLANSDEEYNYYLLDTRKFRYLYDTTIVIEEKSYVKVNKLRDNLDILDIPENSIDFTKQSYIDYYYNLQDKRYYNNTYYNLRGKLLEKTDSEKVEKDLFLDMIKKHLENKNLDLQSNSAYSTNYNTYNAKYIKSFYNLFINENRIFDSYALRQKRNEIQNKDKYYPDDVNKIIIAKYDNETKDIKKTYLSEYAISQEDNILIDEKIAESNVYSRLLDYKKYSTTSEYKNHLITNKILENAYNDFDTSKRYDNSEFVYVPKMMNKTFGKLKFKENVKKLLAEYYYDDSFIVNGRSFYLNSYKNFYYDKIKKAESIHNEFNDITTEKVVYNLAADKITNTELEEIISKLLSGEWVII